MAREFQQKFRDFGVWQSLARQTTTLNLHFGHSGMTSRRRIKLRDDLKIRIYTVGTAFLLSESSK